MTARDPSVEPSNLAPESGRVSQRSQERARNFLSALFMGVRTAQLHDPSNKAFDNAVRAIHESAIDLFASTGGFRIQFVDDSAFLNGVRLRFAGGTFATLRTLRTLLEQRAMGGIEMKSTPSSDAVRKLLLLFAAMRGASTVAREDLADVDIGLLGVQRLADGARTVNVDRRIFAAQCYAKLILALHEQCQRVKEIRSGNATSSFSAPRLRAVRIIQDFIELCGDRADFLSTLALNRSGATSAELHGVNACLLAIVMGHAVGLPRDSLVDVAIAALFHPIGANASALQMSVRDARASVAWLMRDASVGRSGHTRAILVGEQFPIASDGRPFHPLSRIVRAAIAFDRLVGGFGNPSGTRYTPLEALEILGEHALRWQLDPTMIDLLANILRAFPVGSTVVMDSGEAAIVVRHRDDRPWDRPIVRFATNPKEDVDLFAKVNGRFPLRISATAPFLGRPVLAKSSDIDVGKPATTTRPLTTEDAFPPTDPRFSLVTEVEAPDESTDEQTVLQRLERENARLREENETLRQLVATLEADARAHAAASAPEDVDATLASSFAHSSGEARDPLRRRARRPKVTSVPGAPPPASLPNDVEE